MDYAGLTCRNCREFPPLFSAGRSMFHLNKAGQSLVHELKYDRNKRLLEDMPLFLERVPDFLDFITGAVLIPVPLHPKKFTNEDTTRVYGLQRPLPRKPV